MRIGTLGLLGGITALALGPPVASGATIVDSNWNLFSPQYSVYSAVSGGQALAQRFVLNADFSLDTLSIYAKSPGSRVYIVDALDPSATRADVIWSVDFTASTLGWHAFDLEDLLLGAGDYHLVMETDKPIIEASTWAGATSGGRVNLGDLATTTYEAGQFAASNSFTELTGESLTLRLTGEEAVIPAPGAGLMAGLLGLSAVRRRRR